MEHVLPDTTFRRFYQTCYFIWTCVTLEFTTRYTFLWYEPKITTNFKAYCSMAWSQISFLNKPKYSEPEFSNKKEHFCAVSIPISVYCRDNIAPSPNLKAPFLPSVNQNSRDGLGAAVDSELCRGSRERALSHCRYSSAALQKPHAVVLMP